MHSCSQPASESGEPHIEREAVSEGEADLPSAPALEDFKEDATYFEKICAGKESDANDEIIVASSTTPSLLIRQMILDQLQGIDPETLTTSRLPQSPHPPANGCPQPSVAETSDVIDLNVDLNDLKVSTDEMQRAPYFEALSSGKSSEGRSSSSERGTTRSTMAVPWKDDFFHSKLNEMCQSFLEHRNSDFGMPQQSVLLGVTQQRDSLRLDAMHSEALESLQGRLLGAKSDRTWFIGNHLQI